MTPIRQQTPRRLQISQLWSKAKQRLQAPILKISFTRRARGVYGGHLPRDPFARDPPNIPGRRRTQSAPPLVSPAHSTHNRLPQLTPASTTTPTHNGPSYSWRCSPSSDTNNYSSSNADLSDSELHDDPSETQSQISLLEALLEITDDEDDVPQPPGAYLSSASLFTRAAAHDIDPRAISAAHSAFGRRAIALRRVTRYPIRPPTKGHTNGGKSTVNFHVAGESRPPSYSPGNDNTP